MTQTPSTDPAFTPDAILARAVADMDAIVYSAAFGYVTIPEDGDQCHHDDVLDGECLNCGFAHPPWSRSYADAASA